MIKSELVQRLARENARLYIYDVERIVDAIFDKISDGLASGDRIELRGFGVFSVKERSSRMGRNPRTGEQVNVSAKRIPVFKIGKEMHQRLNRD